MIVSIIIIHAASLTLCLPADEPLPVEATPAAPEAAPPPPSLDELLDIDEDVTDDGAAAAADENERDALQRALDEAETGDVFIAALDQMALSAELLDEHFDPGLGTQRVQEEILARLDELIDRAPNQSQQSSGSSSSSSSSQQPGTTPLSKSPGQSGQPNAGDQRQEGDNTREGDPPTALDANPNTIIDETRREWGSLPERIRDMMLQGQSGYKSSLYRTLTEEYYKRLAEEQ